MRELLSWLHGALGIEVEESHLALGALGVVVALLLWLRFRYLTRCPSCGAWGAPRVGEASSRETSKTRGVVIEANGAVDRTRTRTRHVIPRRCGHEFVERFASEIRRDRRH